MGFSDPHVFSDGCLGLVSFRTVLDKVLAATRVSSFSQEPIAVLTTIAFLSRNFFKSRNNFNLACGGF
jgi:hypothetical protein